MIPVIGEEGNYIIIMYDHVTRSNANYIDIILAIGLRPILDIPDQIEIPATAVKIPSSKTILVRNIGDAPATFNFCSER